MPHTPTLDPYEVFAIKYAHNAKPTRAAVFLGGDPHDAAMPLDYFIWVVRGHGRTYVVDVGFKPAVARRRGRDLQRTPDEALALLGIGPEEVAEILITHLHFDHAGGLDLFPRARVHVQQREIAFATGPCMCHAAIGGHYEEDDVVEMVRRIFRGQVCFHHGDEEIAPGLSLHHVGGHTDGSQAVRVWTRRGWLVLASDAAHFYENIFDRRSFMWTANVGDHLVAFDRLVALAQSPDHVIPGHDPMVMAQYPAASAELQGLVVRLDEEPRFTTRSQFPAYQAR
jgi:glyoxylase-like metal-dependent hydrolase (beta-lactamase superfamily II)